MEDTQFAIQYNEFRKRILGPEAEDDSILLLGPYSLHRLDATEAEFAEYITRDCEDGDFVLYDMATKRSINLNVPQSFLRGYFDPYIEAYYEELDCMSDLIKANYKDIIIEIKGYLEMRYKGIKPHKKHFIKWFLEKLPKPVIYFTIRNDQINNRLIKTATFDEAPDIFFTTEEIEKSLHEYCNWKMSEQDAIYDEIQYRSKQGNIAENKSGDSDGSQSQENLFNDMPIETVRSYFKQLTTEKSANGNPFLTREQLENFIDRAFCINITRSKIKANFTPHIDKTAIVKLFYQYYDGCKNIGIASKRGTQGSKKGMDHYIRLLTDNFDDFDFETVAKTFNNSDNHKMKWNKLSAYII